MGHRRLGRIAACYDRLAPRLLAARRTRRRSAGSTSTGGDMQSVFGQRISGLSVDGRELRAAVFNENEVRAAAGMTMVIGAIAFSYAYFQQQYLPLQVVASFFFVEFLIRVT